MRSEGRLPREVHLDEVAAPTIPRLLPFALNGHREGNCRPDGTCSDQVGEGAIQEVLICSIVHASASTRKVLGGDERRDPERQQPKGGRELQIAPRVARLWWVGALRGVIALALGSSVLLASGSPAMRRWFPTTNRQQ